ncbi:MAG: hypothetical protein ABI359_01645 [Ginsengibacter sp.]
MLNQYAIFGSSVFDFADNKEQGYGGKQNDHEYSNVIFCNYHLKMS